MPKKSLPRIINVSTTATPNSLRISWKNGGESIIDVSELIDTFRVYAPLRQSPDLFNQVRVGEYGADIVWSDEIDMSADSLWRLAQEQSGKTISASAFRKWRENKSYTLDDAAAALGISRRMVAYYDHGEKPIPRIVALATLALENNLSY